MSGNRGVVYLGAGKVEVQKIDYPKMQDPRGKKIEHGVILKVVSTNICGSDQHMVRGRTTAQVGLVLGHEITGEIVEKGRDVERMQIGDLVSVPFNVACGRCRSCKEMHTGVCLTVNPARAGAGYSVQMLPDYEFHAAFVYDGQGVPRFLTSEAGCFRGADTKLPLEQLTGFCPLCERSTTRPPSTWALLRLWRFARPYRGRLFAGTQFAARITQVAKHERMTKPVWVATAASDRSQVGVGQRIVAHQFALIGRRIEQLHDLGVGQMLSSCHSCLPDLHGGRPSDPSQ